MDKRTGRDPVYGTGNTRKGPFFDHFHCFFKPMEKEQRQQDIAIYNALHHGTAIPTE